MLHVSYIFLHTYLCKIILQITITETDCFLQNHPNVFRNKRIRSKGRYTNTKYKMQKNKDKGKKITSGAQGIRDPTSEKA